MRIRIALVLTTVALLWGAAALTASAAAPDLPRFRYHGVILEAADLKYRPHDDVIYPSVLHAEGRVAQPLGKLYLYYAPHNEPGGICLAYADKPEGPWCEYAENPIVAGAVLLRRGGKHYLIAHANNSKAGFNQGFDLYVAETDAALERVKHLGKFVERTLVSPENPGVMSPCFLENGGRLCMFFNIGPRLRNKISLAIAEPAKPGPFAERQ